MDESKAIKIIKQEMGWESKSSTLRAFETAIKALEDVQQYRAIGTQEECQKSIAVCKAMIDRKITPENMEEYMTSEDECVKTEFTFDSLLKAREKQTAKRPRIIGNAMICPSCPRCFKSASPTYCPSCGQMIDWGNEE